MTWYPSQSLLQRVEDEAWDLRDAWDSGPLAPHDEELFVEVIRQLLSTAAHVAAAVFPMPMDRIHIYQQLLDIVWEEDEPVRPGSRSIPRHIRQQVLLRDRFRCVKCGSTEKLHIDHILPYSMGGPTLMENLQVLCQFCNTSKGNNLT